MFLYTCLFFVWSKNVFLTFRIMCVFSYILDILSEESCPKKNYFANCKANCKGVLNKYIDSKNNILMLIFVNNRPPKTLIKF